MSESAQPARRPTQLSPMAKGMVVFLVAISFITGFLTSEMLEGQEDGEGETNVLKSKLQQIDPELFDSATPGESTAHPALPLSAPLNWRGLHGLTSPFLAILFGWLMFQHARGGLRMRANLWTGLPLAIVFCGLILTGAFILYPEMLFGLVDPQSPTNWLKETHDLLGWVFLVGFIGHLLGAKKFKKTFK